MSTVSSQKVFSFMDKICVRMRRATVTESGRRRDPRCARLRQAGSDRDAPFVPQGKLKCGAYNGGASPSRVPSKAWGKRGKPDAWGTGQRKSRRAPKTPPCATGESILSESDRTAAPPLRSGVGKWAEQDCYTGAEHDALISTKDAVGNAARCREDAGEH